MISAAGCRRSSSTATGRAATAATSSTSATRCGFARCNCPLRQNERQFQFVNNWTKLQGNHTIKFGADIRHAMNLRIPSDRHRAGELQFNAARTQGPTGGGSALASFLLGDVSVFERYVSSVTDAEERQNRWFFYGQDQWKATPRLTINYGLRWEIYRPQTVTGAGKGGFIDVDTGEVLVAGSDGVGLDLNVEGTLTTLAPRLGMAYRVTDDTVMRMGYGRGYDTGVFGSVFGHNVTQNLPVLAIQSLQPSRNFDSVFNLAQGPSPLDPATILESQPTRSERPPAAAQRRDRLRTCPRSCGCPPTTPGT